MEKLVLSLSGLDCPHCAEKINDRVKKLGGVSDSSMDYINKRMTVFSSDENIIVKIKKAVAEIEPQVTVSLYNARSHEHSGSDRRAVIIRLAAAVIFFAAAFAVNEREIAFGWGIPDFLALAAYLVSGFDVLISAVKNIIRRQPFDETLLMTIASLGAICIGDVKEGAAVMIFFQIGELFQNIAVERSRKSITSLLELKSDTVSIKDGGSIKTVNTDDIKPGDVMVVKVGERVAADGVIVSGKTSFDTSALTGESMPVEAGVDSEVLSGSVNLTSSVEIRVSREYSDSTIAKILEMVQSSSEKKAKAEKFITKFARVYTPIVVLAAALVIFVPSIATGFSDFSKWLYRGLMFLVISCPCALVISVPLGFFAGIGGTSRRGILIKGAKNIESLSGIKTAAFDKTGTLTEGKFTVNEIECFNGADEREVLALAAAAESYSDHPIAQSILKEYGKTPDISNITRAYETAGRGVTAYSGDKRILCGTSAFLEENGVSAPKGFESKTAVFTALDDKCIGVITLGDKIKKTSAEAISRLKSMGITTVMLTGDKREKALETANVLGIDRCFFELLPDQKVNKLEELIENESLRNVAFVGDGINDAPVIARADVGFAMGGLGADSAIEAADVVLMKDDPNAVASAVFAAKRTMRIVKENIFFAIGVKVIVMLLGAVGLADMWEAVFADVGVSFLAVLNALRAMRSKE